MAMAGTVADKSYQMQLQMRRNTEEMSSFLKDMSEWTKEVGQKDENLLKTTDKPSSALPPVRSQPKHRKKKKKKKKSVNFEEKQDVEKEKDEEKKEGKIRGYDYRAWDKFDVDAALKEVDGEAEKKREAARVAEEEEGEEEEEEDEDEEEDESTDEDERDKQREEQKKLHARYHKEKGNEFFKGGKWEDAVECYTKGLRVDSLNAVLFANRAMALLKLQKYAAAITDCDCSIELDDQYTKAYLRRATAHLKLDKKAEALADFRKVLEFEPENKLALTTAKKLEATLEPAVEYSPRKPGDITNMKRTLPASDKPMIRIQIYDITPEDYDMAPTKKGIEEISSKSEEGGDSNASDSNPAEQKKKNPVQFHTLPSRVPVNYLQFQTDIRKLKEHPDALFEYIKKIDPDVYPKLFQESLEADQLFMILDVLNKYYIPNLLPVYNEMYYLTRVKRFNMAVMFKTERQQLTVSQLVEYAAQTVDDKLGIIGLIKAYNIMDLKKYNLKDIV